MNMNIFTEVANGVGYVWEQYTDFMHKYKKSEAEVYLWLIGVLCGIIGFISVDLLTAGLTAFTGYVLPKYGPILYAWYASKKNDYEY